MADAWRRRHRRRQPAFRPRARSADSAPPVLPHDDARCAGGRAWVDEGIADGCAGIARFGGGALADDPHRRRRAALGGYTATAVFSSLIGITTTAWQVGALRAAAWSSRGLRVPARNALLADVVPPASYGRAYGFERAMDNLGAIGGPLLAIGLVALVGTRGAMLISVIPGLLAALAILYAILATQRPSAQERKPLRIRIRPVLQGRLGRLLLGISAFEIGNVAATLLILRATELLMPGRGHDAAVKIGLALYTAYNLAATLASVPGGHLGDRRSTLLVLLLGVTCFGGAYLGLAFVGSSIALLALFFAVAGIAIGFVETAEHAAVATLAPLDIRGSAFGTLAAIQAFGTSPPAPSPACSGPPPHRAPPSSTSPPGCSYPPSHSQRHATRRQRLRSLACCPPQRPVIERSRPGDGATGATFLFSREDAPQSTPTPCTEEHQISAAAELARRTFRGWRRRSPVSCACGGRTARLGGGSCSLACQ